MQSTILVPRLAAAAFAIGLGVAIGSTCGTAAAADSSASDSPSAASSAPAQKGTASAGRTAVKPPVRAATTTSAAKAPKQTGAARAARVTPAPRAAAAEVAASKLHAPNRIEVAMDEMAANLANLLGYFPSEEDGGRGGPVLPLRSTIEGALNALRRATNGDAPNATPTVRPIELHQFVTGEVIGDLRAFDRNGDRLSFSLYGGQPDNAEVVLNENGTYYVKPDADLRATGGTVTFNVAVDDGQQGVTFKPVTVDVAATTGLSQSFFVRNYTGVPLKLTYLGRGNVESGPDDGSTLLVGQEAKFDITIFFAESGSTSFKYTQTGYGLGDNGIDANGDGLTDFNSAFGIYLKTNPPVGAREIGCGVSGAVCEIVGNTNKLLILKDNPGTVATLGPDRAALVSAILSQACLDQSDAKCTFDAKSQVEGYNPIHPVGSVVQNPGDEGASFSVSVSDTQSQTDNYSISTKVGLSLLEKVINLEIQATYGHSWTTSHTFTQTINVPLLPHQQGQIDAVQPVWRVTGDFTVKIGNTTYYLTGATLDTPNPKGRGIYTINRSPLPPSGKESDA